METKHLQLNAAWKADLFLFQQSLHAFWKVGILKVTNQQVNEYSFFLNSVSLNAYVALEISIMTVFLVTSPVGQLFSDLFFISCD